MIRKIFIWCFVLLAPCLKSSIDTNINLETHSLIDKLKAENEHQIPDVVCISLGGNCTPALNFKRCNISKAYYPLDFIRTPFDGLCLLLKTKFKDFVNKKMLKIIKTHYSWNELEKKKTKIVTVVEHQGTKCYFPHDFQGAKLKNYDSIAAKYQRRIDRFYQTIQQAKHIFFFRTHTNKEDATKLYDLLCQEIPRKNFSLIIVTSQQEMASPWKLSGIQEFCLPSNTAEAWNHIFRALKLII